jgi:hypothetical protein
MVEFPMRPAKPSGFDQWEPRKYLIASNRGVLSVYGWVYKSLAIHLDSERRKRGVVVAGSRSWCITHINTGHYVAEIETDNLRALFAEATKLALLADWSFIGLDSWQNQEPDLRKKHVGWITSLPRCLNLIRSPIKQKKDQAKAIALAQGN